MTRIISSTIIFLDNDHTVRESHRSTYSRPLMCKNDVIYNVWHARQEGSTKKKLARGKYIVKICTNRGTHWFGGK